MQVYSKKIIEFIRKVKQHMKTILANEIGLKVNGSRFHDTKARFSYPIKVVVYNHKSCLGYFDCEFFEIGIHERLMTTSDEHLKNIIRHELAHYITFISHGPLIHAHGTEFKNFCKGINWGENVYSATTCLEDGLVEIETGNSILRKIQKLMALSTSSNTYEAELAIVKSQDLLTKHNIDINSLKQDTEEKTILKRILKQKKEDSKMRAIAQILETFFVSSVYSRSTEYIYLEIVGTKLNVEIAEYVCSFLTVEFDNLWKQAKRRHENLKGLAAKNSFFLGIAKGYCDKINFLKQSYEPEVFQSLMVLEKKLTCAKNMVYPHLSQKKSSGSFCSSASKLGEQTGHSLKINPALNSSSSHFINLLTLSFLISLLQLKIFFL
jgi:hypothetical protein